MSESVHITLTPALLARLEQAGLAPGAGNIAVWLTERAETLAALLAPVEGVNVEEVLASRELGLLALSAKPLARALVRERAEAERLRALGRRETALLIAAEQERDAARAAVASA